MAVLIKRYDIKRRANPIPTPRGNPPVNIVLPVISGSATLGGLLSVTQGTWLNSPGTFLYRWQRNHADIPGAVNPTYTIVNADLSQNITCLITAFNNDGAGYAYAVDVIPGALGARLAPTLDFPTAANPPVVTCHLPVDATGGDTVILQWSQSETFSSGVFSGTHLLTDVEASGGTVTGFGIPVLSTGAPWYFRAQVTLSGSYSNTVAWNDAVAPTITTNAAQSQMELFPLAVALTSNKTISSWAVTGGADQVQYEISGSTLRWVGNGTANYDVPTDFDGNNTYVVQVTATDLAGNTTNKTITTTVTAADKTPNAFTFTDVNNATAGQPSTSNTITISGLTSGISVPATVTGGEYSKNGGAFQPAGSFTVQNGDTIALKVTAIVGSVSSSLNVNGVSDSYDVSDGTINQWRLLVTSTRDALHCRIGKLEMRATVGGADLCTGGTASESGMDSVAWPGSNAFDSNSATYWGSSPLPQWVKYTFASNTPTVAQIALGAPDNSDGLAAYVFMPLGFKLQKLVGGVWTDVQTWTTPDTWAISETRLFNV